MIGETPILEFKEENNEPLRPLTAVETKEMNDYNTAAQKKANEALAALKGGMSFVDAVTKFSGGIVIDVFGSAGIFGILYSFIYIKFGI